MLNFVYFQLDGQNGGQFRNHSKTRFNKIQKVNNSAPNLHISASLYYKAAIFPDSVACSSCSDSGPRGKNSRRKQKRGETRGGRAPPFLAPRFPVYNLINSLPTYRLALLSERLKQATDSVNTETTRTKNIFKAI